MDAELIRSVLLWSLLCVNLTRVVIQSNTNLHVAVKVFCRCDYSP